MAVLTIEQYSRKQTEDLETALSLAVGRLVQQPFLGPGGVGQIKVDQFFEDWPSFEQVFAVATAVVLPDGPLVHGPSHFTPRLLEDTWETKGEPGFALYELNESTREFRVQFRAPTPAERNALKAGIDALFVDQRVLFNPPRGARNGILVDLPEYWGLTARLSIVSSEKLDDADSATKNIWEGVATVRAQAKNVKLGMIRPLKISIKTSFGYGSIPRLP